jgi:hypothetical protein
MLAVAVLLLSAACGLESDSAQSPPGAESPVAAVLPPDPTPEPTPEIPDLQAPLVDSRFAADGSPIVGFDFANHTYPLPRGWQNPDGSEITLINGRLDPVSEPLSEDLPDEEKIRRRTERRIGMSHVATRYFDATGDGRTDAIVILKIETTGAAIPQIIYIFEWKDDKPELIWHFRTGDRADGGLKDIRPEKGKLLVELYGQDRFLLGEIETGKITGDEEQLCCPTYFTRTVYEWNGTHFRRKGDRLTYQTADSAARPVKNMGDIVNAEAKRGVK